MVSETHIRDLLVPEVDTIRPEDLVHDARRRMEAESRRSLVVVDDGRLVGMIEWRRVMRESDAPGDQPVSAQMVREIPRLTVDMTVADARDELSRYPDVDMDHFPVVDQDGRYVGEIKRGYLAHGDTEASEVTDSTSDRSVQDIAVHEGMKVQSLSGAKFGSVDHVYVEPDGQFSAFTVERGFLSKKHKRIPADIIDHVDDGTVVLSIEKMEFNMLPDLEDME